MNFLIVITGVLLCGALQARLPALGWLGGIRLELLPAMVAFAALTLGQRSAIGIALIAGLVQDALSAAPFGFTALAYGAVAVILTGMREMLDRDLPWVHMGAGAFASVAASAAALCFVGVSAGMLVKLLLLAVLSAIVTPLLAWPVNYCLRPVHR